MARVVGERETVEPLGLLDLPADAWRELAVVELHVPEPPEAAAAPPASPEELRAQLARVLDDNGWDLTRSLEYCERLLLESALRRAEGNQTQTARMLGITARSVYNKVHKHKLH